MIKKEGHEIEIIQQCIMSQKKSIEDLLNQTYQELLIKLSEKISTI